MPQGGTHPEVLPIVGSGVGSHGLETGKEFYWVGLREAAETPTHQGGEVPVKVHKAFLPFSKKKLKF